MALPRRRHGAWRGLLHAADNLRMAEIVLGEGPQDAERVTVRDEILGGWPKGRPRKPALKEAPMPAETDGDVDYLALCHAILERRRRGWDALRSLDPHLTTTSPVEDAMYALASEIMSLRHRVAALEAKEGRPRRSPEGATDAESV